MRYSAMSGQALFYMGDARPAAQGPGALPRRRARAGPAYALKLLQSEGRLTIASTGKDPATGTLVTQDYPVEGPVMLFLTTTAIELDEELLNRCLVLTVNESREQTRAIHVLQRERQTLDGLLADRPKRTACWPCTATPSACCSPLAVVNPYADQLTLPATTRPGRRRDHEKYLTLIDAIALLHQHQRPVQTRGRRRICATSR